MQTRAHRVRLAKLADDAGTSAVEFAMIAPIFCVIIVGTVDLGGVLYTKFGLDGAVSAAANYAVLNASSVNSTSGSSLAASLANIVASSRSANWANASITVNNGPTATLSSGVITTSGTAANADNSYCPTRNGNGLTWGAAQSSGTACAGGGVAGKFILIVANRAYSPIFSNYGLVSSNATIGATTVIETQ